MKVMNKLVRDKIPEICLSNNQKPKIKILNKSEYYEKLKEKLLEETKEFLESEDIEELADLEQVLRALLDLKDTSYDKLEEIRLEKLKKRGGFKNRIFLLSVEDVVKQLGGKNNDK